VNERAAIGARDLSHVDGILGVEPFRTTGIRITRGAVSRTTAITGLEPSSTLYRLVDADGREYPLPSSAAVMTLGLANILGIGLGDTVDVEILERGGEIRSIVIGGLFDSMIGQSVFMSRASLNALLREGDGASGAHLAIATGREHDVFASLKDQPAVAAANSRAATIRNIDEQIRQSMVFVLVLITSSACVIAMGVVYNSARIALSERGRELASLRVLGFTTNEVAGMLLGEQAAITAAALPVGVAFGALFSYALARGFQTERFHFPYVVTVRSQLFAIGVTVAAGALAGLVVRRRVRRLDMVAALRTRE
jgi:putative ABC transport system permease protein